MKILRNTVIRAGLEALYFSGAHYLLRPIFAGVGAIFMLHHVRPSRDTEFQPNHHLEVEPEFLRAMLAHLRALDIDLVSMDEAHARLSQGNFARRFACFTLDDGYRDNRDFALPVMREFDAPLTVYVASDFAEGTGRLWWIALEMAIAAATLIEVEIGGAPCCLDAGTPSGGGGDLDALQRVLESGRAVLYTPDAVVRHIHRTTMRALRAQLFDNGRAYGSVLCASFIRARGRNRIRVVRRGCAWLTQWHLRRIVRRLLRREALPLRLLLAELRGALVSPLCYAQSRRLAARRARKSS